MTTATTPKRKTKTAKTKPIIGWEPEHWSACNRVWSVLESVSVPVPFDDLHPWTAEERDEVTEWARTIKAGNPARLPDRLKGLLPKGWKPPKAQLEKSASPYREIPVAEICPSADNPRQHFDEAALKQLAESLKKQGQLQNLVVYQHPDRVGYEIIAGERRWRAAKLAGLKTLTCKVEDVTEEEAIQLRGAENEDRQNFTAFELARWYRQLSDRCGMSQRGIANFTGVSQGQVGNTLALLKLPTDWEQLAITQEISPTCLRHLAPWSHRPQVLEAVAMGIKDRGDEALSVEAFREIVLRAVIDQTRTVDNCYASPPLFKINDKLRAELDIEEIVNKWGHKEERAFNVQLWDQHQKAAKKKQKEQQRAYQDPGQEIGPKGKSKLKEGPAEHEIEGVWLVWWSHTLAEKIKGKLTKLQKQAAIRLGVLLSLRSADIADQLVETWSGGSRFKHMENVKSLAELDHEAFEAGLIEHLPTVLESEPTWWEGDEFEIFERFAEVFGIVPERDWEPEYEWLDLLSIDQLRRMPAAEFVTPETLDSLEKKDLIERLLEKWPKGAGIPKVFQLKGGSHGR